MRFSSVLLLALFLAGCFTSGKRGAEEVLAIYDLGLLSSAKPIEKPQRIQPVAIEVRAPLWFDSLGIEYRLAYLDQARLREYGRARWAGPPAQLIQQHLVQQLGFVIHGQSRAGCVLRFDVTEFSQVFDTPNTSHAVLQGRLQWMDRSRRSMVMREVDLMSDSLSADARGGVAALSVAIEQLTATIRGWEVELMASGQLKSCTI